MQTLDTRQEDLKNRETSSLISSDKVEGTPVRRPDGTKIGSIERIMIDKRSGKVAYAVMGVGGFLGIGEDYLALPWQVLRYNEDLDAYEADIDDDRLRKAPAFSRDEGRFDDPEWNRHVHDYYRAQPYWGS